MFLVVPGTDIHLVSQAIFVGFNTLNYLIILHLIKMESRRNICDYLVNLMFASCLIILSIALSQVQLTSTPVPGPQVTFEDLIRREVTRQIEAINNDKVKDEVLEEVRKDIQQIKNGKYIYIYLFCNFRLL